MNTVYHARVCVKKWGGVIEDYLPIHEWFDATKATVADFRHRALRHHAFGIFECEEKFGPYITNSSGRKVPTRLIGELHVREDCGGKIPSVQDWVTSIKPQRWMNHGYPYGDRDVYLEDAEYEKQEAT